MRKIIDRQLRHLIEDATKHNVPRLLMEKGIVPVLKAFIRGLKHSEYFLLEDKEGDLLLTQLVDRNDPCEEQTVVYCFATARDALDSEIEKLSELQVTSLPVTEILFRLFTAKDIDKIVFMDVAGDRLQAKAIDRQELQNTIESLVKANFSHISPNIA